MAIIRKTPIIGTKTVVFSAWEESGSFPHGHGTITSDENGGWLGRIGTRNPTAAWMRGLSRSDTTKLDAVLAFYGSQYEEAYRLILEQYPEIKRNGFWSMGQIEIDETSLITESDTDFVSRRVTSEFQFENWELVFDDDKSPMVVTKGDVVCVTEPNHTQPDNWDARNFRFIAAAPALFAFVRNIADFVNEDDMVNIATLREKAKVLVAQVMEPKHE